jgi:hypothetical protein
MSSKLCALDRAPVVVQSGPGLEDADLELLGGVLLKDVLSSSLTPKLAR